MCRNRLDVVMKSAGGKVPLSFDYVIAAEHSSQSHGLASDEYMFRDVPDVIDTTSSSAHDDADSSFIHGFSMAADIALAHVVEHDTMCKKLRRSSDDGTIIT